MKKRILLLFVAMIGMATSSGWAQTGDTGSNKESFIGTTDDVTAFKSYMSIKNEDPRTWKIIYGNGHAMTIARTAGATAENQVTITFADVTFSDNTDTIMLKGTDNAIIFGGSKEADLDKDTKITLNSGSVGYLIGGGWGTRGKSASNAKTANVKDVAIDIKGGVVGLIYSGGLYRSNVNDITLNIKNATVSHIYCGGFDQGQTTNTLDTEWSSSVNRVNKSTLTMDHSTVLGYLFLGGGQGYSYSKEVEANVSNSTLHCGILGTGSNGRSDKVTATVTGCTFAKADKQKDIIEIAPLNRGIIKEISMAFAGCTFPSNTADYAAYLGATYGYDGKSKVELSKVNVEFNENCVNTPVMCLSTGLSKADATVTGAKVIAAPSVASSNTTVKQYTIDTDKTWTFNEGLEIAEDVTLTNNGTLSTNNKALVVNGTYIVSKIDQLTTALSSIAEGGTISLAKADYEFSSPLVINKAITLKSANAQDKATIKGCIAVKAEGTIISDLAFAYGWKSSKFSDKTGIAVFGNSATITGNTFTTTGDDHGTNGIAFYPQTASAANYAVTGNTFSLSTDASTAIMIRENFKSTTQIPGVAATAVLPNGSAVDAAIVGGNNTFTDMKGLNYCRVTGDYSIKDGTGSGSEDITQRYLYTYTNANATNASNLKDAFDSSKAFSKIQFTGTSAELLTAVNKFSSKAALTEHITVICTDETVYTDEETALANGGQYIKYDSDYTLETPKKKEAVDTKITTAPTASTIEVGQLLSASILTGGAAEATIEENGKKETVVNGTFAWKDPNTTVNKTGEYDVIFTPTDAASYKSATAKVSVTANRYFTVKTGKSENGTVSITGEKPSGRYIKDTTLAITATPNEHYKFVKWNYTEEQTEASTNLKVDKEYVLTATFDPVEYAVTVGEKVTVKNGESSVSGTSNIAYGTVLSVVANPADNDVLESLTCNGKPISDGKVTVTENLDIKATFGTKAASTYLVKAGTMNNGKVLLFDAQGNPIEYGSAHTESTVINMLVVPDYGYELDGNLTVTGTLFTSGSRTFTVGTGDVIVAANFKLKQFTVTNSTPNATIELDKKDSPIDFGTEIKISKASASDGYKLLAIIVNGKEITVGGSFKVEADTKINAVVQELPEVTFVDTDQTYTYNGQAQPFAIRTTPAGIGGITLKYQQVNSKSTSKDAPTDAGEYEVLASMTATDSYKALAEKKIGTLIIKKALYTNTPIPTHTDVKESTGSDSENSYYWSKDAAVNNFRNAYFKLEAGLAKNYENPVFNIPTVEEKDLTVAKIENGGWSFRSAGEQQKEVTLTLKANGGSVSLWNGATQVTKGTKIYADQTLTMKAIPDAGKSKTPTWSGEGVTGNGEEATLVIPNGNTTVSANFADKQPATFTAQNYTSNYSGIVFGSANAPAIQSSVTGWTLSFKQGDVLVTEPTETGVYEVYANRPADEIYAAVTDAKVGTLTIGKVKATVTEATGSDITTAQILNESVISGVANVDGTFEWVNGGEKLTAGTHKNLSVKFTPTDKNYDPVTFETATVNVTATEGEVIVRILTLKVEGEEYGDAVTMTLNGETAEAGAKVKDGDQLKVTFKAHTGYEANATINKASYTTDQEYVIGSEGDVNVVVSYTKKSDPVDPNPGTDPEPETVAVSSVSLDKTTLTLARQESYTLKATVNPSDATNKKVSWKSSDEKIATVDADGKVTAVAVGKATITVTTEDGNKTATCEVTVSFATGIEELIANSRIYGRDGQIVIEPLTPMQATVINMTGKIMYNDKICGTTYVPAASGIYIVKLESGSNVTVQKVNVR